MDEQKNKIIEYHRYKRMQKEEEDKKKSEEKKRVEQISLHRKQIQEEQQKKIYEYNKKKKETEILLGMHLNHSSEFNTDRMYSPQSLKLINDFASKEIKRMANKKNISKPNSPKKLIEIPQTKSEQKEE